MALKKHKKKSKPKQIDELTPKQVSELIESNDTSFVIIDVRTDDFKGGNIKGAVHISWLLIEWNEFIAKYNSYKMIIFHCMQSKLRGPSTYHTYNSIRNNILKLYDQKMNQGSDGTDNDDNKDGNNDVEIVYDDEIYSLNRKIVDNLQKQKVYVLFGGFQLWYKKYAETKPYLIENLNVKIQKSYGN